MNFSEYIAQNRERLEDLRLEMVDIEVELRAMTADIDAELRAMEAYELAKAKGPPKTVGRPRLSASALARRQPREFPVDTTVETMSVPEAGKHFLGLAESSSWVAWRRGEIPSFKIGRLRRVPVDEMRKRLEERAGRPRSRTPEEEGYYPGPLVGLAE